jgi:hypothetical protein
LISVNPTIARACSLWSKYANLTFEEVTSGTPDLEIRFESGRNYHQYNSFLGIATGIKFEK